MERERPEYLPPIKRRRWTFPWLLFLGAVLLVLAVFVIKQHLDTQMAWNARFAGPRPRATAMPAPVPPPVLNGEQADQEALIAERRLRRTAAERQKAHARDDLKCINGTVFRRIPGGWENVPGASCKYN